MEVECRNEKPGRHFFDIQKAEYDEDNNAVRCPTCGFWHYLGGRKLRI